ncbi:MAG: TIGR04372 family glycosyltransferase, partial [Ilumatobacteraceae bacterium]
MKSRLLQWLRTGSGVVALPILVCLWCLRPFIRFRILIVGVHRFGHLALEPEMWLANQVISPGIGRRRVIDLWSLGSRQSRSNRELADLWKLRLRPLPSWCIGALVRAGGWVPSLALERPTLSIHGPRNALDRAPRQISSPPSFSEKEVGEFLEHGIDLTRPYVALVVRDSAYYSQRGEIESAQSSILNADLDKFVPACSRLVTMGYQVVRLGGPSPQRFPALPGFFDYANSRCRTPRLDVTLPSHCAFAIATQTGPDAVALLARRPVLYIDVIRFSQFFFGTSLATWVPVKFVVDNREQPLSARALCQTPWLSAKDPGEFVDPRLSLVRSTSEEVERCVVDFALGVSNHSLHLEGSAERTQLGQWQA